MKQKLSKESRKIVLLIDSATCHDNEEVKKCLVSNEIEYLFIPGGCTSFLQPLDTSLNKTIKKNISDKYLKWLDCQEKFLGDDMKNGSTKAITKAGNVRAPELRDIRNWIVDSIKMLEKQSIINSFHTCGITFGLNSLVHFNQQLQTNLQHLINEYEGRKYQLTYDDEYCDDLERQLRLALQHEDVIIERSELNENEDDGLESPEDALESQKEAE